LNYRVPYAIEADDRLARSWSWLGAALPQGAGPVLYVDHVAGSGVELFEAACAGDMEGIVAKLAHGKYTPAETTWVKIKNRAYSQAEGRARFFDGQAYRMSA